LVIVKANHERGNDIEFLPEIGKRTERFDLLNDTPHTEHACDFPKHWQAIHVEADSGMTEELGDVEKVSRAAAQIENLLGTGHVEFKLANPADVNSNPAVEIEIFRPVCAGICYGVPPADLFELDRIDCLDHALFLQR